ncbi:MAG: TIR domain-containing protein [Pseudomonadota bacterium]
MSAQASSDSVFLSYASQDAQAVRGIADALQAIGVKVWFDQHQLAGGDAWDAKIRKQVQECTLFVPVISATTNARLEAYFRIEWNLAAHRTHAMAGEKAFLLPVVIDDTRDTEAIVPAEFKAIQWTRLPAGADPGPFARRVSTLLAGAPQAAGSGPATVAMIPPSGATRHRLSIGAAAGAAVLALAAAGAAYWAMSRPDAATAAATIAAVDSASIAVLPFANLSSDKEQEYFSDGLSEELLNLLSKLPQLRVIARSSSFSFKGKGNDVPAIAKALHVAHILEGSVRKSGDTLRITTQLIRASDSTQVWSETYERTMTDVFKLQDEIAGAVVAALKVKLLPAQRITNLHQTANTEAYQLYLLGNQLYNQNTPESYRRAVAAYSKAIAADPGYAAAYAGMALAEQEGFRFSENPLSPADIAAAKQRALAAAEKAIALAPDLAVGYAARAFIRMFSFWDWKGAHADFERARTLDPNDSTIARRYGLLQAIIGQLPEAIVTTRKVIQIDPLSMLAWSNLGSYYNANGQLAEARKTLTRALEISTHAQHAHNYLGQTELLEGHAEAALLQYKEAGEFHAMTGTAMAEHTLGRRDASQKALDELIATHAQDRAFRVAQVYAWRGEKDKAFTWLQRAYTQRDSDLSYIKYEPLLATLRDDPRFAAMLDKLALAQ